MNLEKILESVAQGRIDISAAKNHIKKIYDSRRTQLDGLLKKSTDVVQQITENVPTQIEKFSQNWNGVAFSPHFDGLEAKLSLFRGLEISRDCTVNENQVLGSQWFGVRFSDKSELILNKLTAVQLSEVSSTRSNFSNNNLSLTRMHNIALQEARFEDCRLNRSTISEFSTSESDFIANKLNKSEMTRTILNESRIANNIFETTHFNDCEFSNCDIQGIEFENCEFNECVFTNVHFNNKTPVKLINKKIKGLSLHDCKSFEEFIACLDNVEVKVQTEKTSDMKISSVQTASPDLEIRANENLKEQKRSGAQAKTSTSRTPKRQKKSTSDKASGKKILKPAPETKA